MDDLKSVLNKQNETKNQFAQTQAEKSYFLGEYKERIIIALKKNQILNHDPYTEVLQAMDHKEAYILKMSRDLPIKKLKGYIQKAESLKLKYQLVDGISYSGDIGLVLASKEALSQEPENIIVRDMDQDFIDAGLGIKYSRNKNKKICGEHYRILIDKLPEYKNNFQKINFLDKIMGRDCPICKEEKKSGGK